MDIRDEERTAMLHFCRVERDLADASAAARRERATLDSQREATLTKLAEFLKTNKHKTFKIGDAHDQYVRIKLALNTRAITESVIRTAIEQVKPEEVLELYHRKRNAPETVADALQKIVLANVRTLRTSSREYVDFCGSLPKGVHDSEIEIAPFEVAAIATSALELKDKIKKMSTLTKEKLVKMQVQREECAAIISEYMDRCGKDMQMVHMATAENARTPFCIKKKVHTRRPPLMVKTLDQIL